MAKVSRTYRIEQETADRITEIAENENMTATEVVEERSKLEVRDLGALALARPAQYGNVPLHGYPLQALLSLCHRLSFCSADSSASACVVSWWSA